MDVERIESKTYASNCVKKVISTILGSKVSHSFYTTVQLAFKNPQIFSTSVAAFSLRHSAKIGIRAGQDFWHCLSDINKNNKNIFVVMKI